MGQRRKPKASDVVEEEEEEDIEGITECPDESDDDEELNIALDENGRVPIPDGPIDYSVRTFSDFIDMKDSKLQSKLCSDAAIAFVGESFFLRAGEKTRW